MSRTDIEVVDLAAFLRKEEGHHGAHAAHSYHTYLLITAISKESIVHCILNSLLLSVFLT